MKIFNKIKDLIEGTSIFWMPVLGCKILNAIDNSIDSNVFMHIFMKIIVLFLIISLSILTIHDFIEIKRAITKLERRKNGVLQTKFTRN